MFLGGSKKGKTIFLCSVDLVVQGNNFLAPKEGGSDLVLYRFSAFWLRSKYDQFQRVDSVIPCGGFPFHIVCEASKHANSKCL